MISKFPFSSLPIDIQVQFCLEVIAYFDGIDTEALDVSRFVEEFISATDQAKNAKNETTGSALTQDLHILEHERDDRLMGLRHIIQAGNFHADPKWKAASALLEHQYRKTGWSFHALGNKMQSSRFATLEDKLENEAKYKQALETINATEWWNSALKANKAYLAKEIAREKEQFANTDNMSVYKTMRHSYDNLCNILGVMYQIKGSVEIQTLADKLNKKTEKYIARVKTHQTRLEHEKLAAESQN